ncbi:MAG: HlyC/CorC family transporter, partial [Phycisphaerae bacterium]|nr:HlyC/CorC family transporter [Phycisphaerae bacterium]
IPHAWATYAGEKIVYALVRPLVVCRYALYPIAAIMQAFDVPVRRLCGILPQAAENDNAKQEILQAATEGQAEGAVDADEVEMIESVIEFGETQAAEIMTPRTDVFALPVDTAWENACQKVTAAGHTRVPVYEGDLDNIIGILYAKDLLRYTAEPKPKDVREIMRNPFFIPESKLLDDLLREFKGRQVHLAVVLDEYGGTAGLVTIQDVLEEIVGEITDEYDRTEPVLMEQIDEKTAQVDGRMYVDDLNDAMGLSLPEDEDYDTVAGLVFSELGYIPPEGEQLKAHGAAFTILAADERKITKLKVQRIERQTPTR